MREGETEAAAVAAVSSFFARAERVEAKEAGASRQRDAPATLQAMEEMKAGVRREGCWGARLGCRGTACAERDGRGNQGV